MNQSFRRFLNRDQSQPGISQNATKEEFLLEHNRLSPLNLQATMPLLSRFKIEKASIFKDGRWSIDKLRRPFILWLTSLTSEEKKNIKQGQA